MEKGHILSEIWKKNKQTHKQTLFLEKKMQLGKSMNLEKPNYFALCRKARRLILNLLITEDTEDKYWLCISEKSTLLNKSIWDDSPRIELLILN